VPSLIVRLSDFPSAASANTVNEAMTSIRFDRLRAFRLKTARVLVHLWPTALLTVVRLSLSYRDQFIFADPLLCFNARALADFAEYFSFGVRKFHGQHFT
jgi:hypothetical protein